MERNSTQVPATARGGGAVFVNKGAAAVRGCDYLYPSGERASTGAPKKGKQCFGTNDGEVLAPEFSILHRKRFMENGARAGYFRKGRGGEGGGLVPYLYLRAHVKKRESSDNLRKVETVLVLEVGSCE